MICAVSTFLLMIKDDHFISSLLKIALKIDDTLKNDHKWHAEFHLKLHWHTVKKSKVLFKNSIFRKIHKIVNLNFIAKN